MKRTSLFFFERTQNLVSLLASLSLALALSLYHARGEEAAAAKLRRGEIGPGEHGHGCWVREVGGEKSLERGRTICEVEKKKKITFFSFLAFLHSISASAAQNAPRRRGSSSPATMRPHVLPRSRVLLGTATTTTNTRRCHPSCNASDEGRLASTSSASPGSPTPPPDRSSSSSSSSSSGPPSERQQYSYVDAAGKRKATLQDAAPILTSSSSSSAASGAEARAPWELGFQVPERSASLWGDDLRRRLIR